MSSAQKDILRLKRKFSGRVAAAGEAGDLQRAKVFFVTQNDAEKKIKLFFETLNGHCKTRNDAEEKIKLFYETHNGHYETGNSLFVKRNGAEKKIKVFYYKLTVIVEYDIHISQNEMTLKGK